MSKPFLLVIEADDRNDHSSADDYYTEHQALAMLPRVFADGLRHAEHTLFAYVDHFVPGAEDVDQVARLYAQCYVPGPDDLPYLPEPPYVVATGSTLVVRFGGEGGDSARICGPRVDSTVAARDKVAEAVLLGEWDECSQVIVYEEGKPVLVWAGE